MRVVRESKGVKRPFLSLLIVALVEEYLTFSMFSAAVSSFILGGMVAVQSFTLVALSIGVNALRVATAALASQSCADRLVGSV